MHCKSLNYGLQDIGLKLCQKWTPREIVSRILDCISLPEKMQSRAVSIALRNRLGARNAVALRTADQEVTP